jgi:hypothetical protein
MVILDSRSGAIGGGGWSGRLVAAAIFSLLVGGAGLAGARAWRDAHPIPVDDGRLEEIELELREVDPPDNEAVDADADPEDDPACSCADTPEPDDDGDDDAAQLLQRDRDER